MAVGQRDTQGQQAIAEPIRFSQTPRMRQALAYAASAARSWAAPPLIIAISMRLIVFFMADLVARLAQHTHFGGILHAWQEKDAIWYMGIAQQGYGFTQTHQSALNFFPLYSLLIWMVQPFVSLFTSHDSYLIAGMLIAWVTFCAACVVIYRLALDRFGEATAIGTVLLLSVFPFSFYYGAAYTESPYLLLAALAFLGIERRQWFLAGAAALLAGAERPPGLIIGVCVVFAYGLDWLRTRHPLRRDVLALALTPLGAVAYAIYCWVGYGNPLAYIQASREGWHGGYLQSGGLLMAKHVLGHPSVNWIFTLYVLLFILFMLSVVPIARLLGLPYALFAFASLAAPILDFPTVSSLGRYTSVVFPTFIVIAYALRRWPRIQGLLSGASLVMLIMFAARFIQGLGLS